MGIDKRLQPQARQEQFDKGYGTSQGKRQSNNPNHWKLSGHFRPLVSHTMVDYRQRKYKIYIPVKNNIYLNKPKMNFRPNKHELLTKS